jgi:hypothetical protein
VTSPSARPSRPPPDRAQALWALAFVGGAALLVVVGARYRLDRTLCSAWPSYRTGALHAAIYLVGIAALTLAWRRLQVPAVALVGHVVALGAAPFLSSDPLMYVAVGRALGQGAATSTPLAAALGADHPMLVPLPPAWRMGTSAYGPLWNALAGLIGRLTGDDLALGLRVHQGMALACLVLGAFLVARALPDRRAALVAILACPLAVVEATIGAHNDALLVPLTALSIVAWLRGRPVLAALPLGLGLFIKASAALLLAPVLLSMLLVAAPGRIARRAVVTAIALATAAAFLAVGLLHDGPLDAVARVFGRPDVPFDHCTRSLECLPRVLFRFVLHQPVLAWGTGLVFRALGVLWLVRAAALAARDHADRRRAVEHLVHGWFVYYLLLHGWAQSWYLVPLLPALPLLDEGGWARAFRLYLVTAVAYYALVLPFSCLASPVLHAVADLIEAAITIFPPVVLLLRQERSR